MGYDIHASGIQTIIFFRLKNLNRFPLTDVLTICLLFKVRTHKEFSVEYIVIVITQYNSTICGSVIIVSFSITVFVNLNHFNKTFTLIIAKVDDKIFMIALCGFILRTYKFVTC